MKPRRRPLRSALRQEQSQPAKTQQVAAVLPVPLIGSTLQLRALRRVPLILLSLLTPLLQQPLNVPDAQVTPVAHRGTSSQKERRRQGVSGVIISTDLPHPVVSDKVRAGFRSVPSSRAI